jgi:hypothetical protein
VNLIGPGRPEDLVRFNRVGFDSRPGDVLSDTRLLATWGQRDDPRFRAMLADDPLFFSDHFRSDGMVSINGRECHAGYREGPDQQTRRAGGEAALLDAGGRVEWSRIEHHPSGRVDRVIYRQE